MRQISYDQHGTAWDVIWGTTNPDEDLKVLGVEGKLQFTEMNCIFQDPLYINETKTLTVCKLSDAQAIPRIVCGEITNGIYAVGVMT